ncbi:MAG: 16S rRNA (cytidine(1402)-2'-O)-methyltransferase [Gammaproteobacteria bacterium]|nr:16S rRNA (cytidine(1402)-2'-O)-methyltransferase [Gammaproteobacteria bacterium]NND54870.1 16S rRNA (cytidine(1402)-2'-O)-methyltransferase [Gammaproteobacteria bacterium]
MQTGSGTLFVVATPIGNLDDISVRAREVLGSVALVAAEDTRRTGKLLDLLGIRNKLISCHEHNESERSEAVIGVLTDGGDVALVSDAGTPLLSDPGYRVVKAVAAAGFRVSPIPGPSALAAAVSVAGLPTDAILFAGFLPATQGKRRTQLAALADRAETLVLYESVHRITDTVADLIAAMGGERQAVAARELTKLHETLYRGSLAELATQLAADPGAAKGEYTLVIAGADEQPTGDAELDRALRVLLGYLGVRQAAEAAAKLLDVRKNDAYKRALQLREGSDDQY